MRKRLTDKQYLDIVQSMDECKRRGYDGFAQFYDELLTDHMYRGTLPKAIQDRLDGEETSVDGDPS